jgi:hypothetical protein
MSIPRYLGRQGLARFLEISTTRVAQIDPPPDFLLDGAPGWLPETAAQLKRDREVRRAKRRGELTDSVATA